MKRSSDKHWAVLPGGLTRNEAPFLQEQNIWQISLPPTELAGLIADTAQTVALTAQATNPGIQMVGKSDGPASQSDPLLPHDVCKLFGRFQITKLSSRATSYRVGIRP